MNDDLISRAAAIDILDAYQVMVENGEENPYAWARLRMSKLPSVQHEKRTETHACDCISRQAAISELMEWVKKEENKSWSIFKGSFHWTGIKAMLECLPSAQPEVPDINVGDMISRQAAIDELAENKEMINAVLDSLTLDYNTRRNQEQRRGQINEDIETIKALPPAHPGIVRCKECKWYELPSHKITENCVRWMKSNGILLPIKPNDYCSHAERRTYE